MSGFIPMKQRLQAAREPVERIAIEEALEISNGNVTVAAELLEISRKSMQIRMKKFGIYTKRRRDIRQKKKPKSLDCIMQDYAGKAVREAIKNGLLVRSDKCEMCKKSAPYGTIAHHPDYSKPFEVQWLCQSCHSAQHSTV